MLVMHQIKQIGHTFVRWYVQSLHFLARALGILSKQSGI